MGTMCCLAFLIFDQKQGTGEAKMYILTVATSMPNSGAEGMV